MLTRSTAAGNRRSVAFSTAIPAEPSKMNPNTRCCRSRIQDIPDHIQLHSWVSIQLHCSGWTVSTVGCIRVAPPAIRRKTDEPSGCRKFGVEKASHVPRMAVPPHSALPECDQQSCTLEQGPGHLQL